MRVSFFTCCFIAFASQIYSQGCTVSTSNLTQISNTGGGTCTFSVDVLFVEGQGPDNGDLTFTSTNATILTGGGPHTCACSGNTYTITFEAACTATVTFDAQHDNSGNGNDCSVTTDPVTLPVEWLSFEAAQLSDGSVALDWSTALEINNDRFEVEFSEDGFEFAAALAVPGSGTTKSTTYYQATHKYDSTEDRYYRIKQIDFDGRYSYSDIRFVKIAKADQVNIYPNPAHENLHISGFAEGSTGRVIDSEGKTVLHVDSKMIDLSNLPPNQYYIVIDKATGTQQVLPFLKL